MYYISTKNDEFGFTDVSKFENEVEAHKECARLNAEVGETTYFVNEVF